MKHLPIDDRFNHTPIESVNFTCKQTEVRIASQMQHIDGIRNSCTTAIGWMSALLVAFIGGLIACITITAPFASLLPLIVGIIVSCAALYINIRFTLYKRGCYLPGDQPVDMLTDQTIEWLKKMEEGERDRAFKVYWLARQQEIINANDMEISHRVKWYRISLKAALYGYLLTGLLALIAFWV